MSETAVVSSRKSKLESEAENGNNKAKAALKLMNAPSDFLSTVQVGITLIGILTGVFGGATISKILSEKLKAIEVFPEYSDSIALFIVVVLITYFSLILGELLPKRIALSSPETIASAIARPMNLLSKAVNPAVWILSSSTEFLAKLLKIKSKQENFVTEEEIKVMLDHASVAGEVEKVERDIVERVFFLGDADLGSIMTHRLDLICLEINDDYDNIRKIITNSIHSHFPVYDGDLDNIVGVLNIKKLVPYTVNNTPFELKDLLEAPLFVPEKMNAYKLLETLNNANNTFAIAIDEYGAVKGVVTIIDLFRAMVGNLYSESVEPEITQRQDGTYLIDGLVPLDKFFQFFKIVETEEVEGHGFYTVGGLVLYKLGKIPVAGESFAWNDYVFEILDMDGTRVDKVLISKAEEEKTKVSEKKLL